MLLAMAWRNLWRHGRRTLITAAAMAVSIAFVMAMLAYIDGMYRKMAEVMIDQTTGHVQVHNPAYEKTRELFDTIPQAQARLDAVAALPGTRAVTSRLMGFALVGGDTETSGAQLVGVQPERELTIVPMNERISTGHWLEPGRDHEIVLGKGLADTLKVQVGQQVVAVTQASDGSLGNDLYRVVGIVESGSVLLDRSGAWMTLSDLQALLVLPDQVHEITVLTPTQDPKVGNPDTLAAAASIQQAVDSIGDQAPLKAETWWQASPGTAELMGTSDMSAAVSMGIVFAVAGLGILNTMLMSVFERTRELGVMKALGTRPGKVVALVLWESVLLAGLSVAGGLVLGGGLDAFLVVHGLSLTSTSGDRLSTGGVLFDPMIMGVVRADRIVFTVISLVVVSILAALWPAMRAARLRPVDAMRAD